jgi:hypothetical protein
MQYIYERIKELCIKFLIKTNLYYDAGSEKHQIEMIYFTGVRHIL